MKPIKPVKLKNLLPSPKKVKNRVIAGTVAAATALSLLVGTSVDNPTDLVYSAPEPPAVVEMITPDPVADGSEDNGNGALPEERRKGFRARIRELLLKMPLSVRLLLLIPLWAVGTILLSVGGALISPPMYPILWAAAKFVAGTGILLALLTAAVKAVDPEIPVRRILNKKTIIAVSAVILALESSTALVQVFCENGTRLAVIIRSVFMMTVLLVLLLVRIRAKLKST